MNPTIVPGDVADRPHSASRPVMLALAAATGLVAAGTAALWAHYGTAVFYETILAGINTCF